MGVVEGSHADHLGAQARSAGRKQAIGAAVAYRSHHGHAFVDQSRGGLGSRVIRPLVGGADAHVQHLHAISQRALHCRDHDVGRGRAGAAEDSISAELDVGRDTLHYAVGADDACHVTAVASAIIRIGIGNRGVGAGVRVADEVIAGNHARGRERRAVVAAAAAEIRVIDVDAGVHHGDLHARAIQAQIVLGDVGASHGECGKQFR